jgi:hypothetical protein
MKAYIKGNKVSGGKGKSDGECMHSPSCHVASQKATGTECNKLGLSKYARMHLMTRALNEGHTLDDDSSGTHWMMIATAHTAASDLQLATYTTGCMLWLVCY